MYENNYPNDYENNNNQNNHVPQQPEQRQFYTEQPPRGLYSGYMPTEHTVQTPPKKKKKAMAPFGKRQRQLPWQASCLADVRQAAFML